MEKEKTYQEASQKINVESKIYTDKFGITCGISNDSKIDIINLLNIIQNEVQIHNSKKNQKLTGDIDVKFKCKEGLKEVFGQIGLYMEVYFDVIPLE